MVREKVALYDAPGTPYIAQLMECFHVGAQVVQGLEFGPYAGFTVRVGSFFHIRRVIPSSNLLYGGIPPLEAMVNLLVPPGCLMLLGPVLTAMGGRTNT